MIGAISILSITGAMISSAVQAVPPEPKLHTYWVVFRWLHKGDRMTYHLVPVQVPTWMLHDTEEFVQGTGGEALHYYGHLKPMFLAALRKVIGRKNFSEKTHDIEPVNALVKYFRAARAFDMFHPLAILGPVNPRSWDAPEPVIMLSEIHPQTGKPTYRFKPNPEMHAEHDFKQMLGEYHSKYFHGLSLSYYDPDRPDKITISKVRSKKSNAPFWKKEGVNPLLHDFSIGALDSTIPLLMTTGYQLSNRFLTGGRHPYYRIWPKETP